MPESNPGGTRKPKSSPGGVRRPKSSPGSARRPESSPGDCNGKAFIFASDSAFFVLRRRRRKRESIDFCKKFCFFMDSTKKRQICCFIFGRNFVFSWIQQKSAGFLLPHFCEEFDLLMDSAKKRQIFFPIFARSFAFFIPPRRAGHRGAPPTGSGHFTSFLRGNRSREGGDGRQRGKGGKQEGSPKRILLNR